MDERSFYGTGIVFGIIAFLLSFFSFPVESILVGITSLAFNLRKRNEHRILIGMIFTVLGLVTAVAFLIALLYIQMNGLGESNYWLSRVLSK